MNNNNTLSTAEKKEMYNKIMENISQQVIKSLNENKQPINEAYNSKKISRFMNLAKEKANKSEGNYYIFFAEKPASLKSNPKSLVLKYETYACYIFRQNGELYKKQSYKISFGYNGAAKDAIDIKYISGISDENCVGDLLINPSKEQVKCNKNDFVLICCPENSFSYKRHKIENTYYSSIVFENPQMIDGLLVISSNGMKQMNEPEYQHNKRMWDKGYTPYGNKHFSHSIDLIIKDRKRRLVDIYGKYADEISKKLKDIAILAAKGIRNTGDNSSMSRFKNDKKLEMRLYAKLINALYENIGSIDMDYE